VVRTALPLLVSTAIAAAQSAAIVIDYPLNGSIFPPDIAAPTVIWRDTMARHWRIEIAFNDGAPGLRAASKGERMKIGDIDPRCVAATNEVPKLTPSQAASWTWKPDAETWSSIKRHAQATLTITGFANAESKTPLSRGAITITTSKDPVGAPIFYRDVPLMPAETERGVIKPLDRSKLPLIEWRLKNIAEPGSKLLLTGMYTCANCHSFSLDGKTMGMDLDGPKNDKGMYALMPLSKEMTIAPNDVIEWRSSAGKIKGEVRVGFMSQVSPDGRYVVTMVQGLQPEQKGTLNNFYAANFKDYRFLQVFYPTRGILAWYSKETGELQPIPGADDPRYVHTNAVWSPDGKSIVFARAEARDAYPGDYKEAKRANDPNETQIQYGLYRIPFNGGKGGTPERIAGASQNGMSNSFPKVSPDGRWIVYVQARNAQLMRPDGKLYIVPFAGGESRALKGNTPLMNSWHSFSPNGRWLVFSSKSRGPYTKMFLTHIDEHGNSSPAILIENATAANRAVNLPEFVNIPPDALAKIDVPATNFYRSFNIAWDLAENGKYDDAIAEWRKALEMNPSDASMHLNLGVALSRAGRALEALEEYRKGLAKNPNDPDLYSHIGMALSESGRYVDAIAHFEKGLSLQSKDVSPADRATVYDHLGRARAGTGDMNGAIKDFAEANKLHPNFGPYLYDNALALTQVDRLDEAQQLVEAAVKAMPELVEAHELLGGLYGKKRRLAEAGREYQTALKLRPDLTRFHLALANIFAAQGNAQAALRHLREAAKAADPAVAQAAAQELKRLGQR
jgi:tetratricopeptide (TPR) repeat protein